MKIWDKGFSIDKKIETFTVGNDRMWDIYLATADVEASMAHARMLCACQLLSEEENQQLQTTLELLKKQIECGEFVIEEDVEDVHSQIEKMLIAELGEVGKKIHTARSRNDQVLTAMVLFSRQQIHLLKDTVAVLFDELLRKAKHYEQVLLPGYTHTQMAMPSSFGLWFSSYAELLAFDMEFLAGAYQAMDCNPLGTAAGYGSSFPIHREMTTKDLHFRDLVYSSPTAQMLRGKIEWTILCGLSALALSLNKLASDICLFNAQNFGFLYLPKEMTTGSSIMPHKKNPDVFELVRSKTNVLLGKPNELALLLSNLISGYHRDFQTTKEVYLQAWKDLAEILDMMTYAIHHIEVNAHILDDPKYDLLFTVENVAALVQQGHSFRSAYQTVAQQIEQGTYQAQKTLHHTHTGSIAHPGFEGIKAKFQRAVEKINSAS